MEKSRIHGWQAVYRFSLKEHLKGMPFQVMTGLVCLLLLVSLPDVYKRQGDRLNAGHFLIS